MEVGVWVVLLLHTTDLLYKIIVMISTHIITLKSKKRGDDNTIKNHVVSLFCLFCASWARPAIESLIDIFFLNIESRCIKIGQIASYTTRDNYKYHFHVVNVRVVGVVHYGDGFFYWKLRFSRLPDFKKKDLTF